jgi:cytosine/adenosine deaminase-related metal-dependent hydrolase
MGNDGFSFSMWDEWRTCYLAHKMWNQDPRRMGADQVVDIAAHNNARMATKFFNGKIGVIQEGALADLILVDYIPITSMHADNLPWHIIFGFRDSMVTMTMVNGKVLMRDRKLTEINEHEVCEGAQRSSAAVWERYKKQF